MAETPEQPSDTGQPEQTSQAAGSSTADVVTPPAPAPAPAKKQYCASLWPGPNVPVDSQYAETILELEVALGMPLWLLVQRDGGGHEVEYISDLVATSLVDAIAAEPAAQQIALLVDSPGGDARSAYKIATSIRRHCGEFTAIVPRRAKSAATLLVLGSNRILLGKFGELGPLDAQLYDPERENMMSALDEVQALERLLAFSLEALDQSMFLMVRRSGKKVRSIMPEMSSFISNLVHPLFENIDVVHYTQMSRMLKVAEEYAVRLLRPQYTGKIAEEIARHLVVHYPEHGFVIDAEEAASFGLKTEPVPPNSAIIVEKLRPVLGPWTLIGRIKEVPSI